MDARSLEEKDIPPVPPKSAIPRRLRSRLAGERGVSLVELLIVIPMCMIVLMGIYALYNVGAKGQTQNYNRVSTLLRDQNGLERITREMRQATAFTPVSSQILDATTWVRPAGRGDIGSAAGPLRVPRRLLRSLRGGARRRAHAPAGDRDRGRAEP